MTEMIVLYEQMTKTITKQLTIYFWLWIPSFSCKCIDFWAVLYL